MDFDVYQWKILLTAKRLPSKQIELARAALGIAGESGEVAEIIKKHIAHNHPIDEEVLKSEVGDVLWYLSYMCEVMGWSLSEVATFNLNKLSARYPTGEYRPEDSYHE
jgi:NTP pyrophosphatase (non-canonical NTP hydrolase)